MLSYAILLEICLKIDALRPERQGKQKAARPIGRTAFGGALQIRTAEGSPQAANLRLPDWICASRMRSAVRIRNGCKKAAHPIGGAAFVMPYQNRFPAFRKKNHLILRRITIGVYAMLPFRRATAYNIVFRFGLFKASPVLEQGAR